MYKGLLILQIEMPSEKRKARKQAYFKAVKKSKKYEAGRVLKEGMTGFLLTCNNREKEAVREAYNLLNQYADSLFGPERKTEEKENVLDCDDIDSALDKEKESLQSEAAEDRAERRFQQVESGANNCIFIKTSLDKPDQLVDNIVTDIIQSKTQKSRFILRLLPILGTCKAYEKNMEEMAENVLSSSLKTITGTTYSVLFKTRNNNQVKRDDVFRIIGSVMRSQTQPWTVELDDPDICIVVEIIRTVCCLGIVTDFYKKKKYNLVELVKDCSSSSKEIDQPTEEEN